MPLYFSDLKRISESPAHYKYGLTHPVEETANMRIGTYVHELVLGPQGKRRCRVYDGVRRGKEWEAFKASAEGDTILNMTEAGQAKAIAMAAQANPLVQMLLKDARYEVPLEWSTYGLDCATRGVDIIGHDYIADLKVVQSAEPRALTRQIVNMNYHVQLAFYNAGCIANRLWLQHEYVIAVESSPPYPVTVVNVTSTGLGALAKWFQTLISCQESDTWPAYATDILGFELPAWAE